MSDPTLRADSHAASLHKEMSSAMSALALVDSLAVIATACVFTWIATQAENLVGFAGLAWFAPPVTALFGALKSLGMRRHIALVAREIEALGPPGSIGAALQRSRTRRWTSAAAWLVFLALTVGGSGLGFLQFLSECSGPGWSVCGPDDDDDGGAQEQQDSMKHGTHLSFRR